MSLRQLRWRTAALAVALSLGLAGCAGGTTEPEQPAAPAGGAFPVTVTDQFGDVTVEAAPERVVALTMSDADVLVALGVTPVLIEAPTWIPNGINPWLSEALGGQQPEGFTGADGLPLEQIANAEPDLIVGTNSYGISETYEQLSGIAPTIGWDEEQRQLPWQDQTRLIGQALGKSAEADALVSRTEATIAGFATDHPAVQGKSVLFAVGAYDGVLGIGVGDTSYNDLFTEMGMVVPDGFDPSVAENGLSFEQLDALQDLDIMIFQPTDQAEYDAFLGLRLAQTLPVVQKNGIVALLDPVDAGSTVIGIRKPTPLSIPWVFDRLGDRIEEAAVNSGA